MPSELAIRDLYVSVGEKEIIKGIDLSVKQGEVHAIMGPNGSGKSTLAQAIMGHPRYKVARGDILMDGRSIVNATPDERARMGLFLAFQYPYEVPGVSLSNFLRSAYNAVKGRKEVGGIGTQMISVMHFRELLKEKVKFLRLDEAFIDRYVNEGFSGGEKKKCEVLQMAVLEPKIALLDETDSGLDVDALRNVSEGINSLCGPQLGILLITHYQRILRYVRPHHVHILVDGVMVRSGGPELAVEVEEKGYDWVRASGGR